MADKTQAPRAVAVELTWGQQHHAIVEAEIGAINTRREKSRQVGKPEPDKMTDAVGLSLSGGGIRSAAICLGVLQALNHHGLLSRIDYLSTVSGGGYIGSSFTASMTRAKEFVFGNASASGSGTARAAEISDTPAVGHIRNYSNYLIPAGARDLLTGIAIVVRGLVANLSLTLPLLLVLAAITVLSNAARSSLYVANFFGFGVGDTRLFSFLGDLPLVGTFGFTFAGVAAATLVLIGGIIHRLLSDVDRGDFVRFLAGSAFILGVICNIASHLKVDHFALTLAAALLGLLLFFAWALWRSLQPSYRAQEFRGYLPTMGATYLVLLGVIGFFEFQPFMLAEMFDVAEGGGANDVAGVVGGVAVAWVKSLAAIAAPIAAAVTLFRQQFADLLKGGGSDLTSRALAYVARVAVWIACLALPLLIWIGYLYLSYWGIANDKVLPDTKRQYTMSKKWVGADAGVQPASTKVSGSLSGKIQFNSEAKTLSAEIGSKDEATPSETNPVTVTSHIPGWLLSAASLFGDPEAAHWSITNPDDRKNFGNNVNWPMAVLYIVAALILFALSWLLTPNANSLHRLYRDRLSKAFLFNPKYYADGRPTQNEPSLDQGRDFMPLDGEKLSKLLNPGYPPSEKPELVAPYHLINSALNIQGSDFANRRGRNADFFLFSPLYVGSEATHYAATAEFEKAAPDLDLATAMAISGAAASSNMGASSIRPLTPTLALLNVRLGYWLTNPRYVDASSKPLHHSTPLYLWSEITGRLYENADAVYLTDGGHIENLGVYELLRRRCKVIIAVDAEADAPMNFPALMTLQRYARIDLGILIDLPWEPIRKQTLIWMNYNSSKSPTAVPAASDGPHVAIGIIDYGGGEEGYLVYIKSSLTGDENDYICDYARRNNTFPHETTGDQFFSEEQFEVYRALGFHMTHEFLSEAADADDVVVKTGICRAKRKFSDDSIKAIKAVREALGLAAIPPKPPNASTQDAAT
jgi:predicted acylesterase/phospholipase RssA